MIGRLPIVYIDGEKMMCTDFDLPKKINEITTSHICQCSQKSVNSHNLKMFSVSNVEYDKPTNVCCWWCCHPFNTLPFGLPDANENCVEVITVKLTPVCFQAEPSYTSYSEFVVLNLIIPVAGVPGLCAVVPTGTVIAPVEAQLIF